jgi:hypothetical protein
MRKFTRGLRARGIPRRAIPAGLLVAATALFLFLPTIGSARSKAAPVNVGEPQISGSAMQGQTLSGTIGTWLNDPTSFSFQWLRCPQSGGLPDGSDCTQIPGATSLSYVLVSADVGFRIRFRVTASNGDGSNSAASNPTEIIAPSVVAPVNTSQPQISGSPVLGQTLTATTGSWANSPTGYAYQWLHCPQNGGQPNGSDCPAIAGATNNNLILVARDVNFRIRVRVTASNSGGSSSAVSNPTAVVTGGSEPRVTTAPTISGNAVVGQVLTLSAGTWSGTQPISFRYQWLRCDAQGGGCVSIAGAVGLTWRVLSASIGHTIRARVLAINPAGSTDTLTAPTAVVTGTQPPPPPTAGCPAGSGAISVNNLSPPARLLIDRQLTSPTVVQRGTGQIVIRYRVTACGGRPVQGALVYATAIPYNQLSIPPEQATGPDGYAQLQFQTLSGFPVSNKQQLIAMFARARKQGENVLGGISTRRLFSIAVRQ